MRWRYVHGLDPEHLDPRRAAWEAVHGGEQRGTAPITREGDRGRNTDTRNTVHTSGHHPFGEENGTA